MFSTLEKFGTLSLSKRKEIYLDVIKYIFAFSAPFLITPELSRVLTAEDFGIELISHFALFFSIFGWIILGLRHSGWMRLYLFAIAFLTFFCFLEEISWGIRMAAHLLYVGAFQRPHFKIEGHFIDSIHDILTIPSFLSNGWFLALGSFSMILYLLWGLIILKKKKTSPNSLVLGFPATLIWQGLFLVAFSQIFDIIPENILIPRPFIYWFRYPEEMGEVIGYLLLFFAVLEANILQFRKDKNPTSLETQKAAVT